MTTGELPRVIVTTPIKAGREADFETFVRDVIVPASRQARPDLADQWQVLRPATEQPSDAARAYVFFFYGDGPLEDWDLSTLFTAAYGEDAADVRVQEFGDLIDGAQTSYVVDGQV